MLFENNLHHKMNINYTRGIIITLTILACVLHTNCVKNGKLSSKSDKNLNKASSESNHKDDENSSDGKKNVPVETMLLNIATIIQGCIDSRTMNSPNFKTELDNLYKNLVRPAITKSIKKYKKKVNTIKKKYQKDIELLKIMNSDSSKNKENPSKKSDKEK